MKKGDFVGRNLLFGLYGRLIRLNSVDEMPDENYNLFMQMVPECIGCKMVNSDMCNTKMLQKYKKYLTKMIMLNIIFS